MGRQRQTPSRTPAGRSAPQRGQQCAGQPGEQSDVQARNAHQVSHARGPKHVPVGALNGLLLTHDQSSNHTRLRGRCDLLGNGRASSLPGPLDPVPPGRRQAHRCGMAGGGSHIAHRLHALLPHAQLLIKAMRIALAVRGLQAHGHAPQLAGLKASRLAPGLIGQALAFGVFVDCIGLLGRWQRGCHGGQRRPPGIPAQRQQRRQGHRLTVQLGPLDGQVKAHRVGAPRGAAVDAPSHHDVAALQMGTQSLLGKGRGAPTGLPQRHKQGRPQGQQRTPPARSHPVASDQGQHGRAQHSGVSGHRPQVRLVQLPSGAQQNTCRPGRRARQAVSLGE